MNRRKKYFGAVIAALMAITGCGDDSGGNLLSSGSGEPALSGFYETWYAFRHPIPETPEVAWHRPTGANDRQIAGWKENVYLIEDNHLRGFNRDGDQMWETALPYEMSTISTTLDDVIVVFRSDSGSDSASVSGYRADNGKQLWAKPLDRDDPAHITQHGNSLYFSYFKRETNDRLRLDPRTGDESGEVTDVLLTGDLPYRVETNPDGHIRQITLLNDAFEIVSGPHDVQGTFKQVNYSNGETWLSGDNDIGQLRDDGSVQTINYPGATGVIGFGDVAVALHRLEGQPLEMVGLANEPGPPTVLWTLEKRHDRAYVAGLGAVTTAISA